MASSEPAGGAGGARPEPVDTAARGDAGKRAGPTSSSVRSAASGTSATSATPKAPSMFAAKEDKKDLTLLKSPSLAATVEERRVATMLPSLHTVSLDLDGSVLEPFPNVVYAVSGKHNLRDLRVCKTEECTAVPEMVGMLTCLDSLLVQECKNLTSLHPRVLRGCPLTNLEVWRCKLQELDEAVGDCTALTQLGLSHNALTALPEGVGGLQRLVTLHLASNRLRALPASLGRNTRCLTALDVSCNQLEALPDSICGLPRLRRLDLRENKLRALPAALGNLASLVHLDIDENAVEELPRSVGQLASLQELHMAHNRCKRLPDELVGCGFLRVMDLRSNGLVEMPQALVYMTALGDLRLGGNPLFSHRTDSYGREFTYDVVLDQLDEASRRAGLEDFDRILGVKGTGVLLPMPKDVFTISDAVADGIPVDVAMGRRVGMGEFTFTPVAGTDLGRVSKEGKPLVAGADRRPSDAGSVHSRHSYSEGTEVAGYGVHGSVVRRQVSSPPPQWGRFHDDGPQSRQKSPSRPTSAGSAGSRGSGFSGPRGTGRPGSADSRRSRGSRGSRSRSRPGSAGRGRRDFPGFDGEGGDGEGDDAIPQDLARRLEAVRVTVPPLELGASGGEARA